MDIPELGMLLERSRATAAFRADLADYQARRSAERVTASAMSPRIKVLRVVTQLLHAEPDLAVDRVHVDAVSGCADYVGQISVTTVDGLRHTFAFEWNCEWKAQQLGYVDAFGLPDQIRAAEEFGWRCFARWLPAQQALGAATASASA